MNALCRFLRVLLLLAPCLLGSCKLVIHEGGAKEISVDPLGAAAFVNAVMSNK